MVRLHIGAAADFAGLAKQCSFADGVTHSDLCPRLARVAFAPRVFAFGLAGRLLASGAAGAFFDALALALFGDPRRVLHLLLVVQANVDLSAFLALVERALAAPWVSIKLSERLALAAFETGLHLL